MTHKLIGIDQAAQRLNISPDSLLDYVDEGLITPDVPGDQLYFDAKKIELFKKNMARRRAARRQKWLIAGAAIGAAFVLALTYAQKGKH